MFLKRWPNDLRLVTEGAEYSGLLSSRIRSSSRSVDDSASRFAKIFLHCNRSV